MSHRDLPVSVPLALPTPPPLEMGAEGLDSGLQQAVYLQNHLPALYKTLTVVRHARLGRRQVMQASSGDPYPGYNCGREGTVVIDPTNHTWLCGGLTPVGSCDIGVQELPLWMAEAVALVRLQVGAKWDGDGQEGLAGQWAPQSCCPAHGSSSGGLRQQPRNSPEVHEKVPRGQGEARCRSAGPGRVPPPQPWPEAPQTP